MGIFDRFFNNEKNINERIKNINILKATMRQNEAKDQAILLMRDLMKTPSLLNKVKDKAEFGNFLTNQLASFQNISELQFVSEIAFYSISKSLLNNLDPNILYDRLIVLYNMEDFITETVIEANNLKPNPLSRFNSSNHIRWLANDMLTKMRFHDLYNQNKFYKNGLSLNTFNGKEYVDILHRIQQGNFESNDPHEIALKGSNLITTCLNHIARKYSIE